MTLTLIRPDGPSFDDPSFTRRALAAGLFAGYAAAAFAADAEPIHTDAAGLVVQSVHYLSSGFDLPAYVARPDAPGRFPAVIVVSEIFGLHAYIQDICRRLAKLGYVAIAPAFFVRVGDPAPLTDITAVVAIVAKASDPQVMDDIAATLDFLDRQPFVDGAHVGITGFCWGGGEVWLACEQFRRLRAGVAWYGRMVPPAKGEPTPSRLWPIDGVGHLHAPVLGLYGGKDGLAAQIPAMRKALAANGDTSSRIIIYPDAGHGFHADYRDSYVAADAKDGWARMLVHFRRYGVAPRPFEPRFSPA